MGGPEVEDDAGRLGQRRRALFTPVKGHHTDRQTAPMLKPAERHPGRLVK